MTEKDYIDPYPFPLTGGFGFGDDATNKQFEIAWATLGTQIQNTKVVAAVLSPAAESRFHDELRPIANDYLAGKKIAALFDASDQKASASTIVKHIDRLLPEIENLSRLNLPSRRKPNFHVEQKILETSLKNLRLECSALANSRIKPGAAGGSHIEKATADFVAAYETILELPFERSKVNIGTGNDRMFKARGPRLMQVFFQALDPNLNTSRLITCIDALPRKN
jgi:hypothetical protein